MSGPCHSPPLNRLALHREAKDERQIGQAKQVLVAMRKSQSYRNTKLRLIHKRSGMKWLEQDGFHISPDCQGENRFRGYTVYSSAHSVMDLLSSGKPVSCFSLDGDHQSVHIAFKEKETRDVTVSYLTLKSKLVRIVQNTGTHFCHSCPTTQRFVVVSQQKQPIQHHTQIAIQTRKQIIDTHTYNEIL